MSWSLQLRNGDLTVGGARFGQVTGGQKLIQDLRCALLEHKGNDPDHPEWGSVLDGGVDNGIEIPSLIGSTNWQYIVLAVQSEIRRVAAAHQNRQLARTKQDRYTYGESTLTPDELLVEVESVDCFQAQDTLLVQVTLKTGTGTTSTLNIPIPNTPVMVS